MKHFRYVDDPSHLHASARVPAGLCDKADLFSALAAALHFPSYFGRNWDALDECLRDLSWLGGHVVLAHEDLPLAGDDAARRIYLELLAKAAPKLEVVFPTSARHEINALSA